MHFVQLVHRRDKLQERGFIQGLYDSYSLIYKEAKCWETNPAAGPSCCTPEDR